MGDGSSTASTVTRRVKITRIGCRAYVRFALLHGLDGPAMIDEFSEVHNHRLTSVCNKDLDKISRSLDMFQKTLILNNSKLNIGAGLTFRQVKELVNGYENIGATLIDFKNFQRDIKCYIGLRDPDLFIDRLEKLKATQPQFYFAYDVDSQNRLTKFFWADATCIRNYSFFGDAVSFDPTYGTNKYDMVFTPFTGVNHHRKSVLFAGCLLLHEDDISFQWTFQHFLTAMGQKEPKFMITDQCPGIKKVPNRYGPAAIHTRRCDDYNSDHSFPELKTELPIEKHGAIIYTHAVFKVFQEEVMVADSCGVDDFEKEEHVRIIHAYCVGVQGPRDGDSVGLHSSSSHYPPSEQARNKSSGKRLKSAKQQAIEKAAKPKRLCAYCKERVTHDRRTCPLRIADEAVEKAAKKKKV
ncbi:protein FAR1-RELATED SEQUENCE 5-like [Silene latifolia]|uniref:protein FAR1-RELATED SEQUENCE 5-like n=1 Tax=Silene latifolia TaxID=37657 RepID=UPI003D7873BF